METDRPKKADSMYAEVFDINMVDVVMELDNKDPIGTPAVETSSQNHGKMVTEDHQFKNYMVTEDQLAEKMKVAYPQTEENMIDFLNRCKISNTKTMLCPRCSVVFDKEAAKSVEGFRPQTKPNRKGDKNRSKFDFNKRGVPYKMKDPENDSRKAQGKTFRPQVGSSTEA